MGNDKLNRMLITAVVLFSAFIVSTLLIFGKIEIFNAEVSFQYQIYNLLFLGGIIMILIISMIYLLSKKNNKLTDTTGLYTSGKSDIGNNMSPLQLYLFSLIIFAIIFLLFQSFGGGSGTGLRVLPQQFTQVDSLVFATILIPIAENIFVLAGVLFLSLILQIFFLKYGIASKEFKIYAYIIYVLGGAGIAWILHQTVYQGSDVAGFVVMGFWAIGGLITFMTDSPYPFLAMHQMNNLLIALALVYSNDAKFVITITMIIIAIVLYVIFYRNNLLGTKKEKEVF